MLQNKTFTQYLRIFWGKRKGKSIKQVFSCWFERKILVDIKAVARRLKIVENEVAIIEAVRKATKIFALI